jgi:membrane associated rhomboid family serine protease
LLLPVFFFRRVKTIHTLDIYGPAISSGELYRFFTSALIHSDMFSLFNNARAIGSLGGILERSIGLKVIILFFLANTLHAVFSFLFNPLAHSFGGSGVAFAFVGATLYINFFKSSLFSQGTTGEQHIKEKEATSEIFRDESLIFMVRYILIGVLMNRIDIISSMCSLIVGFITCMTLCGDLSRSKTRTTVAVYVVVTSVLVAYTQLYVIHDLDFELRKLSTCYRLSAQKSAIFLTESYIENSDYYTKRNYAYDVQRYVLPMWTQCLDTINRLQARNLTLVSKQRELLDSYSKVFISQMSLWQSYATMFQEEQADILIRVTNEKTDAFVAAHRNQVRELAPAMAIVDKEGSPPPFAWIYQVWNALVVLFMLLLLFIRTFPQHSISVAVKRQWDDLLLKAVKYWYSGPLAKAQPKTKLIIVQSDLTPAIANISYDTD